MKDGWFLTRASFARRSEDKGFTNSGLNKGLVSNQGGHLTKVLLYCAQHLMKGLHLQKCWVENGDPFTVFKHQVHLTSKEVFCLDAYCSFSWLHCLTNTATGGGLLEAEKHTLGCRGSMSLISPFQHSSCFLFVSMMEKIEGSWH